MLKPGGGVIPFFNSTVTVSLAHFIKNLCHDKVRSGPRAASTAGGLAPITRGAPGLEDSGCLPDELHLGGAPGGPGGYGYVVTEAGAADRGAKWSRFGMEGPSYRNYSTGW